MSFTDLDEARAHASALRDLFLYRTGGWSDHPARLKIARLCRAAARSIDDDHCRDLLNQVRERAADLFSDDAHEKWQRSSLSGVYILRLQVLRALDSFNLRLDSIEQARLEAAARTGPARNSRAP